MPLLPAIATRLAPGTRDGEPRRLGRDRGCSPAPAPRQPAQALAANGAPGRGAIGRECAAGAAEACR